MGNSSASERRAFRLMVKGLKPPPPAPITKPPKKEKIEEDLPAHLKKCPACKEIKPLTEFQKNRSKPHGIGAYCCLLYTSPSPRDRQKSRMPSSA